MTGPTLVRAGVRVVVAGVLLVAAAAWLTGGLLVVATIHAWQSGDWGSEWEVSAGQVTGTTLTWVLVGGLLALVWSRFRGSPPSSPSPSPSPAALPSAWPQPPPLAPEVRRRAVLVLLVAIVAIVVSVVVLLVS